METPIGLWLGIAFAVVGLLILYLLFWVSSEEDKSPFRECKAPHEIWHILEQECREFEQKQNRIYRQWELKKIDPDDYRNHLQESIGRHARLLDYAKARLDEFEKAQLETTRSLEQMDIGHRDYGY